MKKVLIGLACAGFLIAFSSVSSQAHSGRTDSSGCHHNRQTGDYHCHNGGSSPSTQRQTTTPRTTPAAPTPQRPDPFWRVLSGGDGDTLTVAKSGEEFRIRLACIDAPETAQSYGQSARERLQALLPVGTPVAMRTVDTDRYGRTVAELFSQGRNINLSLVESGHAVVYDQYVSGCEDEAAYLEAEETAQRNRLEFWSSSPIVMPWEFRRQR